MTEQQETPQWTQRFMVVAAQSMLDLVGMMNQVAHPFARVVYFGLNYGDYSNAEIYSDEVRNAKFIAVFDIAPLNVFPVEDFTFVGQEDGSDLLSVDMNSAMSA